MQTEIDRSKTEKIVQIAFHRRNHGLNPHKQQVVLAPLLDTEQVSQLLGNDGYLIIVCQRSCRIVDCTLAVSNQRLYLLNKSKHSGLGEKGFDKIFQALQYCVSRRLCLASLHDRPLLVRSTISVRHWSPQSIISPAADWSKKTV